MSSIYNEIYLRRSRKVMMEWGVDYLPRTYLASAMKNIERLGFTFSKSLMAVLGTQSVEAFTAFYMELEGQLKEMVGAKHTYKPMYPDFPKQVMDMSDAELYLEAMLHYYTLELPFEEDSPKTKALQTEASQKAELSQKPRAKTAKLNVIELGDKTDFFNSIKDVIGSKSSISPTDKEHLAFVIEMEDDVSELLPQEIPLKENVGFVVGLLMKFGKATGEEIGKYFKTATDVLRLATALSDGDVSLAANTVYRKFKRSERKFMLSLLEQCGTIVEDMLRYRNRWIRLGEILHPSEYRSRYPKSADAFDILRSGQTVDTFGGRVEQALRWHNPRLAAELLAERPGEFARRLDHLLRVHEEPYEVIILFSDLAGKVSTPVLLQVMAHFGGRLSKNAWRTFFPKGNVAKAVAIKNELPCLAADICESVVSLCREALLDRFAKLPSLGKVYIDERLREHNVPFAMRSASKSLRTLSRGSRLAMPEGNTIRFFLWWKEGLANGVYTDRVDIDLSAVMYNSKWEYMEHISYTNLRSAKYKAAHSGDIVTAPKGACEFIDIDIPSVLQYGGRYVVASLNSFTSHPFCDLPECYAGWMMRRRPDSGEIFEPATVADKIDLAADTQISIPVILDLQKRQVIWCDLALKRHPGFYNNVEGNQSGLTAIGRAMTSIVKPSLYDLFLLHAEARGELVSTAAEAEATFGLDEGITPFHTATIMAEYIA
ncbi:cytoplasmic protein [Paenibacillus oryzae]|uniref:Cytoplasmic protein n=1 Tax=Paenibacillus oryzae TaxID=1844972 RepID=A0A1A5YR30_9BACL|nr:TerD family protein [Paenibacillus oryzae]OBR68076.1 cytoplasmic protein [Paenibacillus oryzae]